MTSGRSARRRLHEVLQRALLKVQSTDSYARVVRSLPLRVDVAPASERDLRLLRLLRVQPLRPQRASGHIVARVCGLPLGYIYLGTDPPHETPYEGVWLCRLRVSPSARRLGIAEALIQRAVLDARKEGFGEAFTLIDKDNLASQRLCTKQGFERFVPSDPEVDPVAGKPWEVWRISFR